MYDLIIIGGATSGLTAGIYAARKKLNAVILTDKVGGQALLTETIENYPGFTLITGLEFINKIKDQVLKHGLEIKEGIKVTEIKKDGDNFSVKAENGDTFIARSLIIATGKNPRRLGITGEKEFENRGVSFCSTCDAPLYG
ncbi:MAG: Thioredoxin reductase (NADPH), partial [Parcubacteria group bacterium GW2011_GWD2_40_9]